MGGAQLHGFFHHPVHLVAGGQALYQGDAAGQLGFARIERAQLGEAGLALDFQHRWIFAALAVEQHHGFPRAQPQHADGVVSQGLRQGDAGAGGKGSVAEEAGSGHG